MGRILAQDDLDVGDVGAQRFFLEGDDGVISCLDDAAKAQHRVRAAHAQKFLLLRAGSGGNDVFALVHRLESIGLEQWQEWLVEFMLIQIRYELDWDSDLGDADWGLVDVVDTLELPH